MVTIFKKQRGRRGEKNVRLSPSFPFPKFGSTVGYSGALGSEEGRNQNPFFQTSGKHGPYQERT